ncbi:MAG: hypothetical protein OXU20_14525 [Myxococcales bacterium]|nr:hypothetical protein [Myxococcales bacterium]
MGQASWLRCLQGLEHAPMCYFSPTMVCGHAGMALKVVSLCLLMTFGCGCDVVTLRFFPASEAAADAGNGRGAHDAPVAPPEAVVQTPDAGGPDAGSCGGTIVYDVCWYLGDRGRNCRETCAERGGFDDAAVPHVGTPRQGGSVDECIRLLSALGIRGEVVVATRVDAYGVGCHLWEGLRYWLTDPSPRFDPDVSLPRDLPVQLVCGCRD